MFCTNCGTKLDVCVKFCSSCGSKVDNIGENISTVNTTTNTPITNATENAPTAQITPAAQITPVAQITPTAQNVENMPVASAREHVPIVNVNVEPKSYSFNPMVFLGALLSFIAYFVPFFQADFMGQTKETSYISLINEISKSYSSLRNYSSNSIFDIFAPSINNYFSSMSNDIIKIIVILCVPILLSFLAFLFSFRKFGLSALFAVFSGISMAAIVFYVSSEYGNALNLVTDFMSLRIGVLLYVIGIIMTVFGQALKRRK